MIMAMMDWYIPDYLRPEAELPEGGLVDDYKISEPVLVQTKKFGYIVMVYQHSVGCVGGDGAWCNFYDEGLDVSFEMDEVEKWCYIT